MVAWSSLQWSSLTGSHGGGEWVNSSFCQTKVLSYFMNTVFHLEEKQPRSRHGKNTANNGRSPDHHWLQSDTSRLSTDAVLPFTQVLDPPDKEATGRMQGTSKHLQYSLEVLGKGGGGVRGKHKSENKNKRQTFFFSSTLKWTPLVYTFTFI